MWLEQSYHLVLTTLPLNNRMLWAYTAFGILAISLVHYVVMLARFSKPTQIGSNHKVPPLVPYFPLLLGNIPWKFVSNPIEFFSTSNWFARMGHPVRVRLLTKEFYIIQGPENALALLSQTSTSNTIFNSSFLRHACGMSEKGVARMESDLEEPPNYHERKNYLNAAPLYQWSSSVIHGYLAGRSALQLSRRFERNLRNRVQAHTAAAPPDGVLLDDFIDFFTTHVTPALLDSMCGTGLLDRNPSLPKAFWTFCDSLPTYMKRMPRFLAPQAYKARDEAVAAVKDWQDWASENFDATTTSLDEDGDDPFWGSRFFRERYSALIYEMGFDPQDIASMEVGFLFGASANVTANTYWCVIDVFRDRQLLSDVRKEVQGCKIKDDNGTLSFDVNRLVQQPLLQAVFAESLRLRCHSMYMRKTSKDINILDWFIPGNRFLIAWTTPGHMDTKVWCSDNPAHPVDTFWPGRFLKADESGEVKFSLQGTEGSWLPFGSGANICPGRHFAKVHCILTVAMMVESFECDVLAGPRDLKLDLSKFGMGVLGPNGKVPVRLRRREASS